MNMRIGRYYLAATLLVLTWLSVRPLFADRSLGSENNPVRIMLTPSTDAQAIIRNGEILAAYIEWQTGYKVRVDVPNYYITVVEALGTSRADVAIMNTFSYLLAHSKYGAEARLRVARRHGELTYKGEFIVRADGDIDSLTQLNGRTIAYVDPSSTSGYIYPKEMLRQRGITTSREMFANGHNQVVTKVYQGDVDAGAVFYSPPDALTGEILDARCKVVTQYPDVYEKVKIIALTDSIPNDPVVVRKNLDEKVRRAVIGALLKFQSTSEGRTALMTIASIEGFVPASDSDYNDVRALVERYGINLEATLKK
ncbi:MAG: phosphate/phosphite/phosphonate ABC transporter substrate-binding protein [Ignavibacteria bacterium]|nr:phosphate/phosphite/phosphonate ABC transporter substrate-binding protein [Ignavibacteria bacterium]